MANDVDTDGSVEGKRVVDGEGHEIGLVIIVRDGTVYVEPDPGMTEKLASKLEWWAVHGDAYPLPDGSIERITDEEVHVRRNL